MLNSSLLNILSRFSAKELKEFVEFVSSPFFNKNENARKLLIYLKKFHPDFSGSKLEKEYVYRKIYSSGKYNDGFMRTTIHNLHRLAENYLMHVNITNDPFRNEISLLQELNNRKLDKLFLKFYNEVEKGFDKINFKTEDYYYKKYLIEDIMHKYINWNRYKAKHLKDFEEEVIYSKINHLTYNFLIGVLSDYRILLARMEFNNIKMNLGFVDSIIELLAQNEDILNEIPGAKLHLYEILLLRERKPEHFEKLKEMLKTGFGCLTHDQRYSLHNILQSYASSEIFQGKEQYRFERLKLYKVALEQEIYKGSEDIYFDDILFGMIALNATVLKEFDWTERFISDYKDLIAPENQQVVVNVAMARLYISRKEFKKALKALNDIRTVKHMQYKYPVKDLTLMVFYELSMFTQAYYQLDTYRHFLNKYKNNFPPERVERITNFTKYYTRLLKLKEKFDPANREALKKDLEENPNILNRDWLTEKVNEFD